MTFNFNIDFASSYKICGWTNVNHIEGIELELTSNDSTLKGCMRSLTNLRREDVREYLGLEEGERLGFEINLFDVFNAPVANYQLRLNGEVVWDFSSDYTWEDVTIDSYTPKAPFEIGTKRLTFVYEKGDFIDNAMTKVLSQRPNQFQKNYNFSLAISFAEINEVATKYNDFSADKSNIFIINRSLVRAFFISAKLPSNKLIIPIEEKVSDSLEFMGLLSSILSIMGVDGEEKFDQNFLVKLCACTSAYSGIFFPTKASNYDLIGGNFITQSVREKMKEIHRTKACLPPIIVFSCKPMKRLSDLKQETSSVFLKLSAVKFAYDILALDVEKFVSEALKRGIKLKVIEIMEGQH